MKDFTEFFRAATKTVHEPQGREPYPYQTVFATGDSIPELLWDEQPERDAILIDQSKYGPFRLSYLESRLRIADWRGSSVEGAK